MVVTASCSVAGHVRHPSRQLIQQFLGVPQLTLVQLGLAVLVVDGHRAGLGQYANTHAVQVLGVFLQVHPRLAWEWNKATNRTPTVT